MREIPQRLKPWTAAILSAFCNMHVVKKIYGSRGVFLVLFKFPKLTGDSKYRSDSSVTHLAHNLLIYLTRILYKSRMYTRY